MHDISSYSKTVFWGFLIAFLALAMIPSVTLLQTAKQYFQFLTLWDPGTIQAMHARRMPHHGAVTETSQTPQVYFAEFRLHAPEAKSVFLAGDFNRWKPDALPLVRGRKDWEILVPLPPGKYQYLFRVDDAWLADPKSETFAQWQGLRTSVKEVPWQP